jgi:hypothetical protein
VVATTLSTVGDLATLVAAGAALATVFFAGRTVSETKDLRREAAAAHGEQMAQDASLLDATTKLLEATRTAHEQVMAERQLALDHERQLQVFVQLGRLMELVGEVGEIARMEIAQEPPVMGYGVPGRWTRIPGITLRVEAALALYERLGGEPLPEMEQFARECRQGPIKPEQVVPKAGNALERLKYLAEGTPMVAPN